MPGGPYTKTNWQNKTATRLNAANLNKIEDALEAARANTGVAPGTYSLVTFTVDADGRITSAASGAPGAIADASTTVKGAAKSSVAPASSTNPIFVGDNDPRVGAASVTQRGGVKTSQTRADPYVWTTDDPVWETHIQGLALSWISATQIGVSSGVAWIPGLGYLYTVPSGLTVTPSLSASAWLYIYLFDNAGNAALQASAVAPAAPFKGTARTMTGDTSRRFVGAVRTNSGGTAILKFIDNGGWIEYRDSLGASPLLVLNNGSATTETPVPASSVVPPTARRCVLHVRNDSATQSFVIGSSEDTFTLALANFTARIKENTQTDVTMSLDSSQALTYLFNAASSGANISVRSYLNER